MTPPSDKKLMGFAAMRAAGRLDEVRAIAKKGGIAAHAQGTAHEFTPEEAKAAGAKGGAAAHARRLAAKLDTPIPYVPTESHVPAVDAAPLSERDSARE